MKRIASLAASIATLLVLSANAEEAKVVLVIHGGAAAERSKITPQMEALSRAGLEEAVRAGYAVYRKGGSGLDMVEAAIRRMEDNPVFNAGRGAVFTSAGRNELDSSIMDGRTLKAGAVAGVTIVKNPISAARAVMERSPHVLLVSEGANAFARENGLDIVDPAYFRTEERWKEHLELLEKEKQSAPKPGAPDASKNKSRSAGLSIPSTCEWSTVGAVALDIQGNLAAGTSTGGMSEKRWGRVGDSPIIGAGTYADNETCGVSSTGHGEFFIRYAVAHDIVSLMRYKKLSVQKAVDVVVQQKLKPAGGSGAVIALDRAGHAAASFNSEGLFRAFITADGRVTVKVFDR
ncbi:MAG: isoaspartyl peptidase/L-asparaginase [Verrucomicrobia bacterium]|nr:isoaspartyl peptidase/L-asparaginase [Verrucomicrobiota bacterium]MBI3868509.1 isoaspartyl peptidase/L-asparaginase [Verrucomicrobiota bacterium]